MGNEDGVAPYPCWNTVSDVKISMFTDDTIKWVDTPVWLPAECDVPIRRRQWFWHPNSEENLLSLEELKDIYYRSVGHGTNLLLNIAPDDRGLIPEPDAKRAREFGQWVRETFSNPIKEASGTGEVLEISLDSPRKISHIILMEDIKHGERVRDYVLDYKKAGKWVELVRGSAIGHKKIDRFEPIITDHVRLRVLEAADRPIIREFALI